MRCVSREPKKKKGGEGALKDWILQTSLFSLSQQKIAKENYFHATVLFRGYALSELRMNITACTAAHAELKLKPFVISHRFGAFHAQSSENTIMNPRLEFSQYIHRKKNLPFLMIRIIKTAMSFCNMWAVFVRSQSY